MLKDKGFCVWFDAQVKAVFRACQVARPYVQLSLLLMAFYISLTRISDNRHHPMDVGVGVAVGVMWAVFLHTSVMRIWQKPLSWWFQAYDEEGGEEENHETEGRLPGNLTLNRFN